MATAGAAADPARGPGPGVRRAGRAARAARPARAVRARAAAAPSPAGVPRPRPAAHRTGRGPGAGAGAADGLLRLQHAGLPQQRAHIAGLRPSIAELAGRRRRARAGEDRWKDPAYVRAQARGRFGWVLPGETASRCSTTTASRWTSDTLSDPASVGRGTRPRGGRRPGGAGGGGRPHGADARPRRADDGPPAAAGRPGDRRVIAPDDDAVVAAQLGRPPRGDPRGRHTGARAATPTSWRRSRGSTDGTPFPTTFYLTCPRAASLIGTLEASGLMREMTDRLGDRPGARRGATAARTRPTSRAASRSATCRRSPASRPAGCRPG